MPRANPTAAPARAGGAVAHPRAEDEAVRRLLATALVLSALALGATPLLAGCNTVGGAGQDLSAAGRAVTGTAQETKKAM